MENKKNTSQEKIKNAFTELLYETSFENITVSQISRKAKINRGTFYINYLDKENFVNSLKVKIINDCQKILSDTNLDSSVLIKKILRYLKNDYLFFKVASVSNQFDFDNTLENFLIDIVNRYPERTHNVIKNESIPDKFSLKIYTSSTVGIIKLWLSEDCSDSIDNISDVILFISNFSNWK